jgi:dolichyl-phosphate beta-glucosyltransferase
MQAAENTMFNLKVALYWTTFSGVQSVAYEMHSTYHMSVAQTVDIPYFLRQPSPEVTDAARVTVSQAPRREARKSTGLELSIIIPAYNEEKRIGRTLECIRTHFTERPSALVLDDIEVIVVDDGSVDGTSQVVQKYASELPSLRLVSNDRNRGKGYSIRHGMLEARGRIALFMDADLSFSMAEAEKLLSTLEKGGDVAIGSRSIDPSLMETPPPLIRKIAGSVFNNLVRVLIGLPFRDTQCGLKAFARDRCRPIFEQQRIERFGFDPEILFLAQQQGLKTAEVAVRCSHDPASKVRILRDSALMFWELVHIRLNSICNRYSSQDASSNSAANPHPLVAIRGV